jgi:sugar phosphate permease
MHFVVLLQWIKTVIFFAGAMALASAHRVTFSVLAVPLQQELGLSLPQMGILQSAVLAGYVLGQVTIIGARQLGMHVHIFQMCASPFS